MSSCGWPERVQYDATPLPLLPDPPAAPVWLGEPPQAARATPAGTPSPTSRRKLRRDVFIGSMLHLHVDDRDRHGSSRVRLHRHASSARSMRQQIEICFDPRRVELKGG